jgi:hypothetical protein
VAAACCTGASRFNDPVRAGDPRHARTRLASGTVSRQRCGDDLTRENVMKQAASLNTTLPMLPPGVKLSMSPTDLRLMKQTWLQRFDGERRRLFGDVVDVTK